MEDNSNGAYYEATVDVIDIACMNCIYIQCTDRAYWCMEYDFRSSNSPDLIVIDRSSFY